MDHYESNDVEFIKALRRGTVLIACRVCGQCHPRNSTHLYDYEGTVDDDLICHICFQPFVDPIDTKCGCTFCADCLQAYLKRHKYCPIDNSKVDIRHCHKASPVLRKILDKLLVVCPNVDYCEEVLPRLQLEFHLLSKCKGSLTYCIHAPLGCDFQGPRSALPSHLQECTFNDYIDVIQKEPVVPGRFCQIEIHRGYSDIGIHIVGGCDTPLITTVIQQIKPGSIADKDGRLQSGDHILKLNGVDLSFNTHREVIELFSQAIPVCTMTVYRETLYEEDDANYECREEILKVSIEKPKNQTLGIKLGHKKKEKGVWILDILKNSIVETDGRLQVGDRILEINCQNLKFGCKEDALKIISSSPSVVSFVITRESEPASLITSEYCYEIPSVYREAGSKKYNMWQEYSLNLLKEKNEPLGLVINGGLYGFEGDSTPIFVSSVEYRSCIEKSKHIRKADLIIKLNEKSIIGLSKHSAIDALESTIGSEIVSITYARCPENYDNGGPYFKPNWKYFISIPITYQIAKSVQVFKDANEYLGLTIAGGKDSNFDRIFIKSVIPNSSASRSKKLRSGDMILSVDNFSLQNVLHSEAVEILKSLSGMIRFVIISCPGSVI